MEQLLVLLLEMAVAVMVVYLLCIIALTAIFVAKSSPQQKHDLMRAFRSSAVLPLAALLMFILTVGLKYAFGICA